MAVNSLSLQDPAGFPSPDIKVPMSLSFPAALLVDIEDFAESKGYPSTQEFCMKTIARAIGWPTIPNAPDAYVNRVFAACTGKRKFITTEESKRAAKDRLEARRAAGRTIMDQYSAKNRQDGIAAMALFVSGGRTSRAQEAIEASRELTPNEQQTLRDEMYGRWMRCAQKLMGRIPYQEAIAGDPESESETEESIRAEFLDLGEQLHLVGYA